MTTPHHLPRHALLRYGMLALPLAFAGMPLYIHAPDFYASQVGLPLSALAFALLLLRLFDAIQDPIIGRVSDRFHKRRHQIIMVAALLLVLSFVALFQPPSYIPAMLWFTGSMLLATTAFSVISINLNTLGGLWSRDNQQKTRITALREALGLIGLMLAVILPALLMQSVAPSTAFFNVGLLLAVLMVVGISLFLWWHHSYAQKEITTSQQSSSLWKIILGLPSQTRTFLAIYAVSLIASSIPALLVLFFIRDRLESELYTGMFLALYFLSGVAGMPLWQAISKRKGKMYAWMLSMVLAVMSFVWAYFLGAGDMVQYAVICVISGVAFGADLALPPSILADHIHAFEAEADASSQFAMLTFLAKAALALASVATLPLLDVAGFVPGAANDQHALWALSMAYAAIPCAIKSIAIVMLWRTGSLLNQGDNHEHQTFTDRSAHHA